MLFALSVIKPAVAISQADAIRNEDPCATELSLSRASDNLACVPIGEGEDLPTQCFNFTSLCDGLQFCGNGNDEGFGYTSKAQIVCGEDAWYRSIINAHLLRVARIIYFAIDAEFAGSEGTGSNSTFNCSSNESVDLIRICDGNRDCSKGEDERFILCKSKGVDIF